MSSRCNVGLVPDCITGLPCNLAGGTTWEPPRSTGLIGQTTTPLHLGGGQLLCVYRRKDEKGLWAALARIDHAGQWRTEKLVPIWGAETLGEEQAAER